jgi:hypothetical protein
MVPMIKPTTKQPSPQGLKTASVLALTARLKPCPSQAICEIASQCSVVSGQSANSHLQSESLAVRVLEAFV